MLYLDRTQKITDHNDFSAAADDKFDWRWIVEAVLRHRRIVAAIPLVMVALATAYVLLRPSSYTSSTQLQLTNLRLTFSRDDAFFAETQPDPTFLETQIQIMRSERVALSVLDSLKLITAETKPEEKAEAVTALTRGFTVERVGLSNVVQIGYTARDATQAARVANEFARAYIADQNTARTEAAQSGSSWLRERLREVGPKARVIATALPPPYKSNLRGYVIIAAAGVIGSLIAIAFALIWSFIDRRILTPEQASAATRAECLGIIPDLDCEAGGTVPLEIEQEMGAGAFQMADPLHSFAIDNPLSEVWHTLRQTKAACDDCFSGKGLRYLGVTSTFSGEGRSTVAANLALSIAASGKRVLLVDCDAYHPSLSQQYAGEAPAGLIEYLGDESASLAAYVRVEHRTGLHFLPLGYDQNHERGPNLWSNAMRRLFEECATAYDYVIFDMPSLAMVGDVRAAARYLDGFLLVVRSAQVTAENINVGLSAVAGVHDRLLGTILNKVDREEMRWMLSPEIGFARRRQSGASEKTENLSQSS